MSTNLSRFYAVTALIVLAALSRVLPHPFNFTPIGAMALFGGAYLDKKYLAFVIPTASMLLSDWVIGNPSIPTYLSFILMVAFGVLYLKKVTFGRVVVGSLVSSIGFFLITNFFVWYGSTMYPQSWEGLVACYVAGLAFYQPTFFGNLFFNTVMGDLFYCGALFGGYYLIQKYIWKPSMA
ncbi:MAG: hypothetical protein MUE30_05150 [Spirosomaceae bacterium]|jgi:hypothetical protein|nr:hypothetical protein [Spirosomataceae bacterium]